jgi:DivIVA domain-containing protein
MELTPQSVRSTSFRTARKGYDPDEVEAFKERAAAAIEAAQNQAAAMEARARAAVARLQELSTTEPVPTAEPTGPSAADAETISRTLLLAQRTADATIADAQAEAERLLATAQTDSTATIDNARLMAGRLLDEARVDARRSVEDERRQAENEVQALMARRDFLVGDVEQLEQYVGSQRERLRDAAVQLLDMVDRVPGGFADMRRPLLSAAGDTAVAEPAADVDTDLIADDAAAAAPESEGIDPSSEIRWADDVTATNPVLPADVASAPDDDVVDPTPSGGADPEADTGELSLGFGPDGSR